MHNDNCNYKIPVEGCAVPAPAEPMKDVIADLHDKMMKARAMTDCKYCQDEICVNADCPMRADFCPVVDFPGVCRFEERNKTNAKNDEAGHRD